MFEKSKKIHIVRNKFLNGGPFGLPPTFANVNIYLLNARLEPTNPCFSDLATGTEKPP